MFLETESALILQHDFLLRCQIAAGLRSFRELVASKIATGFLGGADGARVILAQLVVALGVRRGVLVDALIRGALLVLGLKIS
jgi:hypothetical protein